MMDSKLQNNPFNLVRLDNFESEVLGAQDPVLLACLHQGMEFQDQVKVLETVCRHDELNLKVRFLDQDYLDVFKGRFKIGGTPTYFIFRKGKEIGRLLGQVDRERLMSFIFRSLPKGALR